MSSQTFHNAQMLDYIYIPLPFVRLICGNVLIACAFSAAHHATYVVFYSNMMVIFLNDLRTTRMNEFKVNVQGHFIAFEKKASKFAAECACVWVPGVYTFWEVISRDGERRDEKWMIPRVLQFILCDAHKVRNGLFDCDVRSYDSSLTILYWTSIQANYCAYSCSQSKIAMTK